jgi:phage gp29-like protein
MLSYAVLLGFAVGQLVWEPGDDGQLIPRLLPWPPSAVSYDEHRRTWVAHTDAGPTDIVPGSGAWVLYAPKSVNKPWLWGVIRCLVEWYLRAQNGAADASRHAEVHGLPVWLARLPSGSETSAAGRRFLSSIRNMGRNAVVPLPRGDSEATSYDLELEAAQTDAYRIYEFLLRAAGGKFRLAILGQDLTSQNNQVGTNASSETGADTLAAIVRADAVTWGECCTAQIARPLAVYRGSPPARVQLDAEPDDDFGALATALETAGRAVQAWQAAGWEVDLAAIAERFGVPGKRGEKPAPAPPTDPKKPVESDEGDDDEGNDP